MTRFLLPLVLLISAAAAAQPTSVVVTQTTDGFGLSPVTDAPLSDDSIVLSKTADGWHLLTPRDGETGRDAAARVVRLRDAIAAHDSKMVQHRQTVARHRTGVALHRAQIARRPDVMEAVEVSSARPLSAGGIGGAEQRVRYTVWFSRVPADVVPAFLADVADDEAFRQAEVQGGDGRAEVELSFVFGSVEAWTEWTERTRLEQRFADDPGVRQRTTVEVVRALRARLDDIITDVEIEEDLID